VAQQSKCPACCVACLGDGGGSSSGSARARDTVLGCSDEAGLCLRAAFSLRLRARTSQSHQEPLANIFGSGMPWEQGWVLQGAGKGPSLGGDVMASGGAEPACGGQEVPTGYGGCEVPATHAAARDDHRLVTGGCTDVLGGGQPVAVAGCVMWRLWALWQVLQTGGVLRPLSLAAFCCNDPLSFRARDQLGCSHGSLHWLSWEMLLAGDFGSQPRVFACGCCSSGSPGKKAVFPAPSAAPSPCHGEVLGPATELSGEGRSNFPDAPSAMRQRWGGSGTSCPSFPWWQQSHLAPNRLLPLGTGKRRECKTAGKPLCSWDRRRPAQSPIPGLRWKFEVARQASSLSLCASVRAVPWADEAEQQLCRLAHCGCKLSGDVHIFGAGLLEATETKPHPGTTFEV